MMTVDHVEANLLRDQNNFRVLLEDSEGGIPLAFAPDCSDLIEFIHIEDPDKEQVKHVYREAIRRYFLNSERLVLAPSWTYEFLAYIHRVVIDNIHSHTTSDGRQQFFKKHPNALRFYELWSSKRYREAKEMYDVRKEWVQILAFTEDDNVINMLGNPIERYNHLIRSKRIVSFAEVTGGERIERDAEVYERMLSKINEIRPKQRDVFKNQIDADSCATVAWLDGQDTAIKYTAVTMTGAARDAYYNASNDPGCSNLPFSHVRSPITYMIHEHVNKSVTADKYNDYLQHGIDMISEIRQMISSFSNRDTPIRLAPSDVLSEHSMRNYHERTALGNLLAQYELFFKRPIIRPILDYGSAPRHPITLSIQKAGEVLDSGKFERRMKEATRLLGEQTHEMVDLSHGFITKGEEYRIGQSNLSELITRIEDDFKKHIY